jgi:glutamyl-tRNA(Gln) amidotransferase subunit E
VQKILNGVDNKIIAINVPHFSGMLGKQPNTEIRLGKQLSEFVRFYGLGGIFHSDELPNYGISKGEVTKIKQEIGTADDDAFILVGGPDKLIKLVERDLCARLNSAINGAVAETRSVLPDGSTIFMRPRPGSARMYPETDIPYFTNNQKDIENLKNLVPLPWDKLLSSLSIKYGLNTKLAIQIYDSEYFDLFEDIASATKIPANFIASILTEDFVSFRRQGLDTSLLNEDLIGDAFKRLNEGKIAKESLPLIFEKILKKEASDLDGAISLLDITTISNEVLKETIDKVIFDNQSIVVRAGNSSMGFLMGRCMAILRGKVDGEKVNRLVAARLRYFLNKTKGN